MNEIQRKLNWVTTATLILLSLSSLLQGCRIDKLQDAVLSQQESIRYLSTNKVSKLAPGQIDFQ